MGFRGGKTDDAAEDAAEDVVAAEAVEVVVEDGEAAGLAPVPIAEDGAVDDDDADYVDTSCWGKCWCRTIIMVVTGGLATCMTRVPFHAPQAETPGWPWIA